ncbi:hypothetical protein ACX1NX_13710 [Acinetobacter sp. ANC 5383]
MMIEALDPKIDEVDLKTMLQCDRGIKIFAGMYNAEVESFAAPSACLATGGAAEYIFGNMIH